MADYVGTFVFTHSINIFNDNIFCHLGILEARCEAVVCVEAVEGGPSWKGQIQVYTDNSVLNVDVNISGRLGYKWGFKKRILAK